MTRARSRVCSLILSTRPLTKLGRRYAGGPGPRTSWHAYAAQPFYLRMRRSTQTDSPETVTHPPALSPAPGSAWRVFRSPLCLPSCSRAMMPGGYRFSLRLHSRGARRGLSHQYQPVQGQSRHHVHPHARPSCGAESEWTFSNRLAELEPPSGRNVVKRNRPYPGMTSCG